MSAHKKSASWVSPWVKKQKTEKRRKKEDTPGTRVGLGGRCQMQAVKRMKNTSGTTGLVQAPRPNAGRKSAFFRKKIKITLNFFLLVMPKYWWKIYFSHRSFSEVGEKHKVYILIDSLIDF